VSDDRAVRFAAVYEDCYGPSRQNLRLPPGINFTAAEYRLLIDMVQTASGTSSSSITSSTPPHTSGPVTPES
jgi:hypothetical protein